MAKECELWKINKRDTLKKYIWILHYVRSLASESGSDSVSNFSVESAHTQNTQIERISAMLTESINARKAEYYDLSGNELDTSSSSSDGQNYNRNHIHIDDHFNSIRGFQNESIKGNGSRKKEPRDH